MMDNVVVGPWHSSGESNKSCGMPTQGKTCAKWVLEISLSLS